MRAARALAALALAAALGACAKRADREPAAAAPPPAEPASADAAPGAGLTQAPPPPAVRSDVTPGKAERDAADPLWAEFDRFDREVALSTGDCATACRALASLERAAKRVCEGSAQLGEAGRCGEATRRLREARGRVRAACARCAGGASTDPDAPAP